MPVPCASQACWGNWHTAANQVHGSELGDSNVTGLPFLLGLHRPGPLWCSIPHRLGRALRQPPGCGGQRITSSGLGSSLDFVSHLAARCWAGN